MAVVLSKHSGPLLGYNNNIPYKGNVYHVQTEDSGSKRPHVFTHLFADGGRIVKTMKTSYAHFVGAENLTEKVRALMREQHKAMVISLRDGDLDVLIDEGRAEIEEREAPQTIPPPEVEKAGGAKAAAAAVSDDGDGGPPAKPIELLERAAAEDDHEFIREIEGLVPDKARPSGDPDAGTYSFVGKSSPAKASGAPQGSTPPNDDGPPTVARPRGSAPGRERPDSRTDPDFAVAQKHAAAASKFGASFLTSRRFDQVVRAFLEGESP